MGLNFSKINNSWDYKKAHMNLDNFATFMWRGAESFNDYHTFIISGKDELKFYNGPSFSNEYTTPQFQSSSGNITGVKFNRQTLSFKIGIYWFTIKEYQRILNWLNAYEIDYLSFDFDDTYGYLVKLTGRSDSQRTFLGYDNNNERVYYTEMTLNWELQGPACARSKDEQIIDPYKSTLIYWKINDESQLTLNDNIIFPIVYTNANQWRTFLESPILYEVILNLNVSHDKYVTITEDTELVIKMYGLKYYSSQEGVTGSGYDIRSATSGSLVNTNQRVVEQELFNITLKNLPWRDLDNQESFDEIYLHLTYDSEAGIVYYNFGNSPRKLLTMLTTVNEGVNMVKTLNISKYIISGEDRDPDKLGDCFIVQTNINNSNFDYYAFIDNSNNKITTYLRNNVI